MLILSVISVSFEREEMAMNDTKAVIDYMELDSLIPYVNNPRHNDNAVDKVASSIAEFGFKVPIVVDKDKVIITGHTRYLAAKKLGLTSVPVIVAKDLTDAQVKAYRIADNKVSEYSSWDNDALKIELEALQDVGFDLDLTGMTDIEIESLTNLDDIPDAVEIEKEEGGGEKVELNSLKFCGKKVPMTDEEADKLNKMYEEYTELEGTDFGFVGHLLKGHGE